MTEMTTQYRASMRVEQPANGTVWMVIFFITLLLPISFEVGGIRLSPLRLFVLCGLGPAILVLAQGKVSRVTATDGLILIFSAWIILSMVINHGTDRLPLTVAFASETATCYLLGRLLVRGPDAYVRIFSICAVVLCALLVPAIVELFTGRLVISDLFAPFFDVIERGVSADKGRLGLNRVYTVFAHPILFGIFCATMVANFALVLNGSWALRLTAVALAIFMTFMALSSAPLLSVAVQLALLAWWKVTRGAWWTLAALSIAAYAFVDIAASRSPLSILFSYATFDPHSGWIRIAIFDYGSRAAIDNPVFGIGLKTWAKPDWVPNSVDNFWLVIAMRHGLVGLAILVLAIVVHLAAICRVRMSDPRVGLLRIAYLVSQAAMMLTLATVHVWDSTHALVLFLIGAGGWFYTTDLSVPAPTASNPRRNSAQSTLPFTRFPAEAVERQQIFQRMP